MVIIWIRRVDGYWLALLYNSYAATESLFDFGLGIAEDKAVVWKCAFFPLLSL